jgi:predicted lipoprotein with Yx(FWY)xxD motif
MPLYHWGNDMNRGDMGGEGRGDVWFTIAPETLAVSNSDELGEFLVGANGMTLYQFSNDENGVSNCLDECAETWLPLLVNPDDALVGGLGVSGELGTLTRADESIQVTYNGMPLYYWLNDTMLGDTGGNNLGEAWFVVKP